MPPVEEMTVGEVDAELRSFGIDPRNVTRRYYSMVASAASAAGRVVPRSVADHAVPTPVGASGALASQLARLFRGGRRDGWSERPWQGTHVFAEALRGARVGRAALDQRLSLLNAGFSGIEEAIGELSFASGPNEVDPFWPVLEALEEAAAEVAADKSLAECFAARYVGLARRCSTAALLPVLGWGINEFLERGPHSARLGSAIAHRLVDADTSDQVRCVLAVLRVLRPSMRRRLPMAEPESRSGRDLIRSFFKQTRAACARPAATALGSDLQELLHVMPCDSPLASVMAMGCVKVVLRSWSAVVQAAPEKPRRVAVEFICRNVIERAAPADNPFLAIEAMEGVRDRFPGEFGLVMAGMLAQSSPAFRQGIVVCMAEGYEEDYGGRRQRDVPQFTPAGSRLRFKTPAAHPLDSFGKRAATLAGADASMRPHLDWMNARLRLWKDREAA